MTSWLTSADPGPDDPAREGARRIVTINAAIRSDETALILTDLLRPATVANVLAQAVADAGGIPLVLTIPPFPSGAEPPAAVAAAMGAADVILSPLSGAIYHTVACKAAVASGARFLALTMFGLDNLRSGGVYGDFPALAPRAERLAALMSAASEAHVVAPGGTDLRLRLDGRVAVPITGMARHPGEATGCPDIEAFIAPLETSAEGVIVADRSASITGVLHAPLRIVVRGGQAVVIDGPAAPAIVAALDAAAHPHARTLAELAFGLNPAGIIRGVIVEDEGVARTGHIALGSNRFFGGTSAAPIHLDFVYDRPTLRLDGVLVIDDGELVGPMAGC